MSQEQGRNEPCACGSGKKFKKCHGDPASTTGKASDTPGQPTVKPPTMSATYWQHKVKCTECSLHFVVCSWYEMWPDEGTTRAKKLGEATGLIHCPECGSCKPETKLIASEQVQGFIFQMVPGDVPFVEVK